MGGEGTNTSARDAATEDRVLPKLRQYVDVLTNPCCRKILYFLLDRVDEPANVDALARHLTAVKTGYSPDTLVRPDFVDVQREVTRNQLPAMSDYGIVEFDAQSETVRLRRSPPAFVTLLRICRRLERLR